MSANIPSEMTKKVNLSKWVVSDEDTVIVRKEDLYSLSDLIPSQPAPGALVLGGSTRWVRTAKKVKNPSLRFKVIVGPYGFDDINAINLVSARGAQTNTLKVQISSDAASWEDVDIEARNISNPGVNIFDGGLDPTSPITSVGLGGGPNAQNNVGGNIKYLKFNADGARKPEYEIKIARDQLSLASDSTASFYIKIIQETISNISDPIWAISEIEIISREQTLIGQTGLQRHSTYGLTSSVSSPNFLSNLQVENAISLPYQSDNNFTRSDLNPSVSSFKDDQHVPDTSREFYQYGISKKVYPGFDSSLLEKNKIEIDISTQINSPAGYTRKSTTQTNPDTGASFSADTEPVFADFMVYYNKDLKKWEPVGRGTSHAVVPTLQSDDTTPMTFGPYSPEDYIMSSAIGFSGMRTVATGSTSSSTDYVFYRGEYLNTICRPVKTFGFPAAAKYHATGSQLIQMSDYISKPFLVEKVVWDVDANVTSPGSAEDGDSLNHNVYRLIRTKNSTGGTSPDLDDNVDARIHTFFICRQYKGKNQNFNVNYYSHFGFDHNDLDEKNLGKRTHTFKSHDKIANSSALNYFDVLDNRELVTYSQITEFARSSTSIELDNGLKYSNLIKSKLVRDSLLELSANFPSSGLDQNIKFIVESPVKLTGKITDVFASHRMFGLTSTEWGYPVGIQGNPGYLHYGDDLGGRSIGRLDDSSRTIVNSYPARPGLVKEKLPSSQAGNRLPFDVNIPAGELDQPSPYILFPEDEILIGYQYPLPENMSQAAPGSDATVLNQTIFNGEGRLILYGSEIKDNKEYHGGLNQNLTSNVIHTVIGDEPVIDQFQVATRGELTGSFVDTHVSGFNEFGGFIEGSRINVNETSRNLIQDQVGRNTQRREAITFLIPKNRMGVTTRGKGTVPSAHLHEASSFHYNLIDISRTFVDARYRSRTDKDIYYFLAGGFNPEFRPEYGSMQNITADSDGDTARFFVKRGGCPKYYYTSRHFGHYADLMRQGLDGKFVDDPSTTQDNIFTEPPVRIRFAEGIFNSETRTKQFQRVNTERIQNTAEREFQSSNLSLNATSSIAFKDDNVARNRVYGTFEIVT